MSLTSASTYEEIRAAYIDNSMYADNGSASEARLFVQACRLLLLRTKRAKLGNRHEIENDHKFVADQLREAKAWIAANASDAGGVRHGDFRNFRD